MFRFVPFRDGKKPGLRADEASTLDRIREMILDVVAARRGQESQAVAIDLAPDEIRLLKKVIEADISQCGTDDSEYSVTDYRIHFASERQSVASLLNALKKAIAETI